MNNTHATTRRTLPLLLAALCLCAGVAARPSKEAATESPKKSARPSARKAQAAPLRDALTDALGDNFEIVNDGLRQRSDWQGGGLFWLAQLRAKRAGAFHVKYKYRYKDHVHPEEPLYDFVERETLINVGPRGCSRAPRSNFVCVGDAVILPVVVDDFTEHSFNVAAQPFAPANESTEKSMRDADVAGLYTAPVKNPASKFLKYLGSRAFYSPHRAHGYTMSFYATFEAVRPGGFNLSLGLSAPASGTLAVEGSVPVVIVARGAPITILSSSESVHGYTERFSSSGGDSYMTTPVILQPGDRITLQYHGYRRSGLSSAGGENEAALEASVKDYPPFIALLPFDFDPERDFNEWVVEFLPQRAIMRPTNRGR
jgi:hypothetical protein